jgi:hypothetical protein
MTRGRRSRAPGRRPVVAEPQKEMSGVLFRNDRRRDGKQDPNLQGSCTIDGRRYWISAWTNTVQRGERRGEKYVALSFRPAEERPERDLAAGRDDDIPF